MALMHASIFFDLRCVSGDSSLLENLQQEVLSKTKNNSIFLSHLTANALKFKPPIGLFRHFVLEDNGHEDKALNMKKRGVVPVTDLARVLALSSGVAAINTQDRLEAASAAGVLSKEGMSDLRDALEFIATV
ncbi:MAG: cyclic nucleotide-binding/CBS domain-containing protein, partial [Gammaproteobacteria bacterium]|nr:cyclic nucleotide-binding/CBS domain-containing protein [Gammaproteobacteria bacterium]